MRVSLRLETFPPTAMIDPADLELRLRTRLLGRPLRYFPSVPSTQDIARAEAEAGAAEGLAVVAGEQTAGRGRSGRTWWSPPAGGLYLSLLFRPGLPPERVSWLTMAVALGAAEGIEAACGLRPGLKWPNDLEWEGRKLAGILAEAAFQDGRMAYAVVGLGLNVNTDFSGQPLLRPIAVSLAEILGRPVDEADLLAAVLERIEGHYLALQRGVSPAPAWSARLVTLGRPVTAHLPDGRLLHGLATRTLEDGALCIQLDNGTEEVVRAVDVSVRHGH